MKRLIILLFVFVLCGISFSAQSKNLFVHNLPNDVCLSNSIDTWVDLPATSTATILATTSISTATLVASGTSYTLAAADYTDVIFPRNLIVDVYFAVGESTSVVTGNLIITGYNQLGKSMSETIAISTTAATGVVAWSTVTNLEFTDVTATSTSGDASLSVGVGTKIGLSNNIQNSGDILKCIEDGATSTTYTLSTTYETTDFASDPDGSKDYYIYYTNRTNNIKYKY